MRTAILRVLTLNILNKSDRWTERLPLLREGFAALKPDIAGLQEVFYPLEQERLIASSETSAYRIHRGWADRAERGNSLLIGTHLPDTSTPDELERLDLGHGRSALRARLELFGRQAQVAVTHLHHLPPDEDVRDRQVEELVRWLHEPADVDLTIVIGDFNAEPDEIAARRMVDAGYRSAFLEANHTHPSLTFPSGLQAPDREDYIGWPEGCLDYIWLAGDVTAVSADLCFDRAAADDPTLFASDHFGVFAVLALG